MAISYVKKKIKLPINGNVEERYVAKIQYTGHVDEDNIAEHISNAPLPRPRKWVCISASWSTTSVAGWPKAI